eukprot:356935_1
MFYGFDGFPASVCAGILSKTYDYNSHTHTHTQHEEYRSYVVGYCRFILWRYLVTGGTGFNVYFVVISLVFCVDISGWLDAYVVRYLRLCMAISGRGWRHIVVRYCRLFGCRIPCIWSWLEA